MRVMKSTWNCVNCAGVVESEKIFSSETLTIKRIGMDTSWLIVASSSNLRFFLHWPCNIPFYNSSRSWLGNCIATDVSHPKLNRGNWYCVIIFVLNLWFLSSHYLFRAELKMSLKITRYHFLKIRTAAKYVKKIKGWPISIYKNSKSHKNFLCISEV